MDKKFDKVSFLYASLKEAQDNIRTYDTKAQIVGIGYIFTMSMLAKLLDMSFLHSGLILTALEYLLMLAPIILFTSVLYPTRKLAPSILRNRSNVKALFYPSPSEIDSVDSFLNMLDDIKIKDELAYELLKVSVLRDLKRKRFLRALLYASLSLLAIFILQILVMYEIPLNF